MITRTLSCAAFFTALAMTAAAAADLDVISAWSRATPKGAQVASGYLTIVNRGAAADRLLSASTKIADKVEIHQMAVQDGVMTMRPLQDGLAIAPGDTVSLAPGADHLMLIGLHAPLQEGDRIAVSLAFEKAGVIDVAFDVEAIGARGPRLRVADAAAQTASAAPAAATPSPAPGFFTHICGTKVMANVTVSPRHADSVMVEVQLMDAEEKPLTAKALGVAISNPSHQPLANARAERIADDRWRVRMQAPQTGQWQLALTIDLGADGSNMIDAPVLIE